MYLNQFFVQLLNFREIGNWAKLTRLSQRSDTLEAESTVTVQPLQAQKAIQEVVGALKVQLDDMKMKLSIIEDKVDNKIKSVNKILNNISAKTPSPSDESMTTSQQLKEVESKPKSLDAAIKKVQIEQRTSPSTTFVLNVLAYPGMENYKEVTGCSKK